MAVFRIALIIVCALSSVEGSNDEFIKLKKEMIRFQYEQQGKLNLFKQQFEDLEQTLRNEIKKEKLKNEKLEGNVQALAQKNLKLTEKVDKTELKLEELQNFVKTNFNKVITQQVSPKELTDSDTDKQRGSKINDFYKMDKHSQFRTMLKTSNSRRVAPEGPVVAFFSNTLTEYTNVRNHEIVHFSNATVNYGNCFHGSIGDFSCQTSGTYVFSYSLICAPSNFIKTALVKDGVVLNYCSCDGKGGHFDSCSSTTIAQYTTGESLWVRVELTDPIDAAAFSGENSFSGFLLHQD